MTLSSVQPKASQQSSPVHGVWQLLTYTVEVKETGETFQPMGDKPTGYVIFTPEGRLSFTLSAEGRQPATSDQERAALLSSVIAYTGSYRL
ncbi:MAG: lipocalin-like domain-containing protein, partial [Cyanobacteria bacterium]|nr:lipocalin-like domain-containing protein [Cyanobacteriota bacterium]